ncbi:putative lipid II flippase FtsW [Pasteuria penetrans]|uniref:putative lipid II flippase FtsW n=1 Tax=Pasteuria penetrans TaxID=86005 RepID=UPI000FABEE0C|nr:putative lipid II flippase FtsW [Pasteuria penetrans]
MLRSKPDFWLLFLTFLLLGFGIVMVFSASYHTALTKISSQDSLYFVRKQIIAAGLGIIVMLIFSKIPYRLYSKHIRLILLACVSLLLVVGLFGTTTNGSKRWLAVGPLTFQPSELIKIGLIMYTAAMMVRKQPVMDSFWRTVVAPLFVIGSICTALILQPHYSAAAMTMAACLTIMFCAGLRWKHVALLASCLIPLAIALAMLEPYRLDRILSALDPLSDPQGKGYQTVQSLLAIGSGGWTGLGAGNSIQKLGYLPEAHNDFIFSIVAEEYGNIGATLLLIAFALLLFRGIQIALRASDLFGMLLAIGLVALLAIEILCHVAVANGLLPVTGIPLPLISYGGTVFIVKLMQIGILLNISQRGGGTPASKTR